MTSRAQIVEEARSWIGTRWQHQAAHKGVGTDCIGLIAGVAAACGIAESLLWQNDPTRRGYTRRPDPSLLREACERYLDPIALDAAQPGDVLLFRFTGEPSHFGILSGRDYVIHAYAQARQVVENRLDELWRSRLVGGYCFRGLDG